MRDVHRLQNCIHVARLQHRRHDGAKRRRAKRKSSAPTIYKSSDLTTSVCKFRRSGMTLVELLVVLAIMLLLAAATIPRSSPRSIDRGSARRPARSNSTSVRPATRRSPPAILRREDRAARGGERLFDVAHAGRNARAAMAEIRQFDRHGRAVVEHAQQRLCLLQDRPLVGPQRSPVSGRSDPDRISRFLDYLGYTKHDNPATAPSRSSGTLTGYVDITHGETPAWTVQQITGPSASSAGPTKSAASALAASLARLYRPDLVGRRSGAPRRPADVAHRQHARDDHVRAQWLGRPDLRNRGCGLTPRRGPPRRSTCWSADATRSSTRWTRRTRRATSTTLRRFGLPSMRNTGMIVVTDNAQCTPPPPAPPATYSGGSTATTCLQTRQFARQSDAMGGK